ncbi:MAG TPA: YkgJ family cysteine cluster protein [Candidatus Ozemobacteraceae bacterium]|nr:YkgJ family cysteine cluster protein [Candidatus Ozemobacteraceae bacterium]HQG29083.1 YkgJ family cysteine cluster protein [Candidatus Ozemobacteraceae bacterium]
MKRTDGVAVDAELLGRLMRDVEAHADAYVRRVLTASAEYGTFGLPLLEKLHGELPKTTCDNCGACCNAVSIFSLEYHRIVRDLLTRFPPARVRELIVSALRIDLRLAELGNGEKRLRCSFRDDTARVCVVHPVRSFACRLFGMKHDDGHRDCKRVRELDGETCPADAAVESMMARIHDVSESHEVRPGEPPVAFFPFEFWLFRHALGPKKALEIYEKILVPASTPLTALWKPPARVI